MKDVWRPPCIELEEDRRKQSPRHDLAARLQAGVWLQYAIHKLGSAAELAKVVCRDREDSHLVAKWQKAIHLPSRSTVRKLERLVQGGLALFDLPLWKLLENRRLDLKQIDRLMSPFRSGRNDGDGYWKFPNDDELRESGRFGGIWWRDELEQLRQRGDIYGFTAIVAAVRTLEVYGADSHCEACAYTYRMLPSLYKFPWFASQRHLLEPCLDTLRRRSRMCWVRFDVDWDVINRQTLDPAFEPKRELRKIDPADLRYVDLEDPILYAEWIPGKKVKRRGSS